LVIPGWAASVLASLYDPFLLNPMDMAGRRLVPSLTSSCVASSNASSAQSFPQGPRHYGLLQPANRARLGRFQEKLKPSAKGQTDNAEIIRTTGLSPKRRAPARISPSSRRKFQDDPDQGGSVQHEFWRRPRAAKILISLTLSSSVTLMNGVIEDGMAQAVHFFSLPF